MSIEIEQITNLFFAIAGLFWGVYQYSQGRIEKRKDILFELVAEFDKSENMKYAKRILDDYNLKNEDGWQGKPEVYHNLDF